MRYKFLALITLLTILLGKNSSAQVNFTSTVNMIVTGLPFSGQEWTTIKTTQANGRIAKIVSRTDVTRNSLGSTRRELRKIPNTGNITDPTNSASVVIRDQANGRVLLLDMNAQTVSISPLKLSTRASFMPVIVPAGAARSSQTQDLGQKAIANFVVQGTRETFSFPIGTKSPDHIVTATRDTWYSSDLKCILETDYLDSDQHSETTLLQNIVQSEPPGALFTIPLGFTSSKRAISQIK